MNARRSRGPHRFGFALAAALVIAACNLDLRTLDDAPNGLTPLGAALAPGKLNPRPSGEGTVIVGWLTNPDDPGTLTPAGQHKPSSHPLVARVAVVTRVQPSGFLRVRHVSVRHRVLIGDLDVTRDAGTTTALAAAAHAHDYQYAADFILYAASNPVAYDVSFASARTQDTISASLWLACVITLPGVWYTLVYALRALVRIREFWRESAERLDRKIHRALRRPFEPDASRGLCTACGYDLAGLPGPTCPECGIPTQPPA